MVASARWGRIERSVGQAFMPDSEYQSFEYERYRWKQGAMSAQVRIGKLKFQYVRHCRQAGKPDLLSRQLILLLACWRGNTLTIFLGHERDFFDGPTLRRFFGDE